MIVETQFKTAHYFKSGKKHILVLSQDVRPSGKTVEVTGKKQAREIAGWYEAKCWNF